MQGPRADFDLRRQPGGGEALAQHGPGLRVLVVVVFLYDVDQEDIVPSGVAEIAHLQAEGYSYVKP